MLIPSGIGSFGLAVTSTAAFDPASGQNTALTFTIPATMRLSENTRINLNGGWLWDRQTDRHYLTYGIGFDMRTPDNVWTLTLEMFGQVGSADAFSTVQPRAQAGNPLSADRSILGRPDLRPQHHRRERQLAHARDRLPFRRQIEPRVPYFRRSSVPSSLLSPGREFVNKFTAQGVIIG